MIIKKICIVGGTGFVGRRLANHLAGAGYALRIPTRDRERHKDNLILLPKLELVEADVHDPGQLSAQFAGCDAVINLAGILNERSRHGTGFHQVHVELTRNILTACHERGIKRLLHMSALNADSNGPSHYLRTKGEAEALVHDSEGIHVTSFRPSVIFGPGDSFFNRFATLLKLAPGIFPLACAGTRFSPVFVGDVAGAMAMTLHNPDYYHKSLELCGPGTYTLGELVRYTTKCIGIKRLILPLPDLLSRMQATVFDISGFLFNLIDIEKPFSTDNYLSMTADCIGTTSDLETLGINPTSVEASVPQYLSFSQLKSRYYSYRQHSRRSFD